MFIARDKDGSVHGFTARPKYQYNDFYECEMWCDNYRLTDGNINWETWCPFFTYKHEPIEIDITWLDELLKLENIRKVKNLLSKE